MLGGWQDGPVARWKEVRTGKLLSERPELGTAAQHSQKGFFFFLVRETDKQDTTSSDKNGSLDFKDVKGAGGSETGKVL